MSSRDEWRITSASIELEMERIAGLLQKSVHCQFRTSARTCSSQPRVTLPLSFSENTQCPETQA
jgi:hypothetical protein